MATTRTFIAVKVPEAVRRRALDLVARLGTAAAGVKWVEPQNLHWTLKFLGEVSNERLPEVCDRVRAAACSHGPFRFAVGGAGAFPNAARPRVIWLGVPRGAPALVALQESVDSELEPMGFRREGRRYVPHLTLGRVRGRAGPEFGALVEQQAHFDAGAVQLTELVVLASYLGREGPTYQPLGRAPLGGA